MGHHAVLAAAVEQLEEPRRSEVIDKLERKLPIGLRCDRDTEEWVVTVDGEDVGRVASHVMFIPDEASPDMRPPS